MHFPGSMEHELQMANILVKARRDSFKSPKPDAPRVLVYDIFCEVNRRVGYSNLLLPGALNASNFDQRDKGFVTELLYGTLRMQGRHDYILAQVSDRGDQARHRAIPSRRRHPHPRFPPEGEGVSL